MVHYDWGSHYFRGVNIHCFTEKKTKWEIYKFITNVIMQCNSSDVISKSFDVGKRWSGVTWGQPISPGVTWVKPIFFQYFLNILAFVEVVLYFYKVSN